MRIVLRDCPHRNNLALLAVVAAKADEALLLLSANVGNHDKRLRAVGIRRHFQNRRRLLDEFTQSRLRPPVAKSDFVGTGRAERVDRHRREKELLAAHRIRDKRARRTVETNLDAARPEADGLFVGRFLHLSFRLHLNSICRFVDSLEIKLPVCDHVPLLENAVIIVQRDFAAHADRSVLDAVDGERGASARCDVERMRRACRPLRSQHRDVERISSRLLEVIQVLDGHILAVFGELEVERLEHVLNLVVSRLWRTVGENSSIHHELAVVRLVAEVAAVCDDKWLFRFGW